MWPIYTIDANLRHEGSKRLTRRIGSQIRVHDMWQWMCVFLLGCLKKKEEGVGLLL